MTRESPPELFVSERPVRSDFARDPLREGRGRDAKTRERIYARRRKITLAVLALVIAATAYALMGHSPTNPADIPTIKADLDYKQKPSDPGGINIPHQDVRVYDQLEGKNGKPAEVEHLLPPPEKPMPEKAPETAVVTPVAPAAMPAVAPLPPVAAQAEAILPAAPAKKIVTTVTPAAPAPVVSAPVDAPAVAKQELSIEQVIADTKAEALQAAAPKPAATGAFSIQLASTPDEAKAQAMTQELQKKYATQLGEAKLQTVRADLGSRGIFYRIQSQGLSETDANHICAALKQMKTGCILVRK